MLTTCISLVLLLVISVAEANQEDSITDAFNRIRTGSEVALLSIEKSPYLPSSFKVLLNSLIWNSRPCQSAEFERFRRIDGVCNNLKNPYVGAVLDIERRLFSNNYSDGRKLSKGVVDHGNKTLPSPREVSLKCFGFEEDGQGGDEYSSQLVWQFGQFLAHDITLLIGTEGKNCCETVDYCEKACIHPDALIGDGGCFPIAIPLNDTFYNETNCMSVTRTFGVDFYEVREHVNGITSFVDSSNIYGSSKYHVDQLRFGSMGLLKTTALGKLLPIVGSFPCNHCNQTESVSTNCPASGDIRVNVLPGLSAMHTMFHRAHNGLATTLFYKNMFWTDERTFQEARKIIIGIMQKIVYEDYLPLILGTDVMSVFDLDKEFIYDSNVNPTAILEFTTAAFRFGHSQVNTKIRSDLLSDYYFMPITDPDDVQKVLLYQADNIAQKVDNLFTEQLRGLLFKNVKVSEFDPKYLPGLDLVALNIHRGRDHGLPPYWKVRDECKRLLKGIQGVEQDPPACLLEDLYSSEEDVDLYVGGVTEKHLPGAILGPTFACVVGNQFQHLKFGDRFFYQGNGIEGFTEDQREFIRRNTLASLICELNDEVSIQRDAFRPVSISNPKVSCKTILEEVNRDEALNLWKETSGNLAIQRLFMNIDLHRFGGE